MKRGLFNTLTVLSLLLCITTVVLWVRCRSFPRIFDAVRIGPNITLYSFFGNLKVQWFPESTAMRYTTRKLNRPNDFHDSTCYFVIGDCSMARLIRPLEGHAAGTVVIWNFALHDWFVSLGLAILPVWWAIAFIRRRRIVPEGCCTVCGYDLRATPDRCPECGTVPAKPVENKL